jgi:hypothetical protein
MARFKGSVLVDTNVILECWRIGAWRALANGYMIETVEDCVEETLTGYQRRRPERQVDVRELRQTLSAVHQVGDPQLAVVAVAAPDIQLDLGERSLWAHALSRSDAWLLCGPDKASLRFGVRLGFRERLVALETLLTGVGHRPKDIRRQFTTKWSDMTLGELALAEGSARR